MDDKWFKTRQRIAGVTADAIADKLGRDRSIVSKIYAGKQRMSIEWAQAFADVLNVPLADVLEKAGVMDPPKAQTMRPGFSDGDAMPWIGKGEATSDIGLALGQRPGIDIWRVQGRSMMLGGLLPDDFILVDTFKSELVRPGDVVIAQIYDWQTGSARTVLRRFEPPVLVAASPDTDDARVHVVDGNNVAIKGKVVASWRV